MVKARVLRLDSPDADLRSFVPDDPENFGILVEIMVGPVDGPGEESFDVMVCTPRWLQARIGEVGPVIGRHHLFVERYDWTVLRQFIGSVVESEAATTWAELGDRIGRIGKWEFEDYVE